MINLALITTPWSTSRTSIMAVQQNRKTRSKRGMRRSHDAIQIKSALTTDPTTGERHRRHHVSADGFYKGEKVIDLGSVESTDSEIDNAAGIDEMQAQEEQTQQETNLENQVDENSSVSENDTENTDPKT